MLRLGGAAALQHIEEANHIGVDVGRGIFQAVSDAGLGGEVDHALGLHLGEKLGHGFAVSQVDARLCAASDFGAMDFATRNSYRTAIEDLARGSAGDELAITDAALVFAAGGQTARERDPGFVLVERGRPALEAAVGYVPTLRGRAFRIAARGSCRWHC